MKKIVYLFFLFAAFSMIGYKYSLSKVSKLSREERVDILKALKKHLMLDQMLSTGENVEVTGICKDLYAKPYPTNREVFTIFKLNQDNVILSDSDTYLIKCPRSISYKKVNQVPKKSSNKITLTPGDLLNKTIKVSGFCKDVSTNSRVILKDEYIDVLNSQINIDEFRIVIDGLSRSDKKNLDCTIGQVKINLIDEKMLEKIEEMKRIEKNKSNMVRKDYIETKRFTGTCFPISTEGNVDYLKELRVTNLPIAPVDENESEIRGFIRLKDKNRYVYCTKKF